MEMFKIMRMAALGKPEKFFKMITWTIIEYLLRGLPFGISLLIIWELFIPLTHPGEILNISKIIIACSGLLAGLILLYFASRKAYFASFLTGYEITAAGRKKIIKHLKQLPMGFYNSHDPGDIGAYIVTDYKNIEELTTHMIPQFFGAMAMPVILVCSLFFYNWKLALAALIPIPVAYPLLKLTNWLVMTVGKHHQKITIEAASRMLEYIQGIHLIKAFNLNASKFSRLENSFRRLKNISIKMESIPGSAIAISSIILNSGIILIILYGFRMLQSNEIPLPIYILFLVMGIHIYQPFINAITFLAEINYMKLGVKRTDSLLHTPVLTSKDNCDTVTNFNLSIKNIYFKYHNTPVIDGISLEIPEKSLTAFVGPSGSGKTTLTRLISRFWDVDRGEITLGGLNIESYNPETLMSQIAIVFQDVYLFNDTIYNNIRIGREDATDEEVMATAKLARCHEFITSLPQGYQSMVGEGGCTLSGGEKQRISIARAILKDAPIILLDEATASLDPENELSIQRAINDLIKDKTVIMIAHRLHTIQAADLIFVIDNGKVIESGKHIDLLQQNGLYKALWDEQQKQKSWKF